MTDDELTALETLLATATASDPPCTCKQYALWQIHGMYCAVSDAHTKHVDVEDDLSEALREHAPALLTLARRGLRAKREVCGTCADYVNPHFVDEPDQWQCGAAIGLHGLAFGPRLPTDFCSRWRAKGGE